MIEDHWVQGQAGFPTAQGKSGYDAAPTVCVNRYRSVGTPHRELHDVQGIYEDSYRTGGARAGQTLTYAEGKRAALNAHDTVFSDSECDRECLEAQLDDFYGDDGSSPLKLGSKRQGVGDIRETLEDAWGGVLGGS